MGRRRKFSGPPPKHLDAAFPGIDLLETRVIEATATVDFTIEQVVRWMFPDTVVDHCQRAFPFVRDIDRGLWITERLVLPLVFPAQAVLLNVKAKDTGGCAKMLVPTDGIAKPDENRFDPIRRVLTEAYVQHSQFEKVRRVTNWLNDHATVGASRHYCPWLTSVLPADHPFQTASGTIYREPAASMAGIIPVMRECGAIMASALLCGEGASSKKNLLQVAFGGSRETSGSYTSQQFTLL